MEDISLSKYLEEYTLNLDQKFGNKLSFSRLSEAFAKKEVKPSGIERNIHNDDIDFPWLDELEIVTEKIMAIASNPRTHIKFLKDVKKAEQAVKIDNWDIKETTKVSAFWKEKDGEYLPERVFTDVYETEYAIYENRFIINLIDKMMLFLSQTIAQLYELIRKVNRNFVDYHVSLSDVEIIRKITESEDLNISNKKTKKTKDTTLLTTKESPYVDALRRILKSRENLSHVLSTPFYREVKKTKALSDSDVHITNMLAQDKTYSPCFNFYRKLLPLLAKNRDVEEPVDLRHYHNFVVMNILKALEELEFKEAKGKKQKIVLEHDLVYLDGFEFSKKDISVYLTTDSEDHIDMVFEINYGKGKYHKTNKLKNKRTNIVSLDLVPTTNAEYMSAEELTPYFRKKIANRLSGNYTNAFVITSVDNTQKDDVIICSPFLYKIDANVKSMIQSCIVFSEGDNYIYSRVCPVCGYYVDGEQEDGNCYCSNCDSIYSLLTHGKDNSTKETVWIKRMKNPEKI